MDEIIRNLYVGTVSDAASIPENDEWRLLCVLEQIPQELNNRKNLVGVPIFNPLTGKAVELRLRVASMIIDDWLLQDKKVLIFCGASIERSPLTAAYYLSRSMKITIEEAYSIVESKHPITQRRINWLG